MERTSFQYYKIDYNKNTQPHIEVDMFKELSEYLNTILDIMEKIIFFW